MRTAMSHRDQKMDYRSTGHGSLHTDRISDGRAYLQLLGLGALHVPVMYVIMFSMVDGPSDIYQNLNTFYMAVMMAAPMVALMPFTMKSMYPDRRKNLFVVLFALLLMGASFLGIRTQAAIGDSQFIRSMIPHHSGAILMCDEASILDQELRDLCSRISSGQREEIRQMERILERL